MKIKVKQLIEELKKFSENADIWIPCYNGHETSFSCLDWATEYRYDEVIGDMYGTVGRYDKRLYEGHNYVGSGCNAVCNDKVVILRSNFSEFPNPAVDKGDDDINYDIRTINGPDGDEHLVWHLNEFEYFADLNYFKKQGFDENGLLIYEITYMPETSTIYISNIKEQCSFTGKLTGIEDIRNAIRLCKIKLVLFT